MSELHLEELSDEAISVSNFTWDIVDFFSLTETPNFLIESPSFVVGGATWCLQVYPCKKVMDVNGWMQMTYKASKNKRKSVFHIGLRIVRLESLLAQHTVSFNFQIKDCYEEETEIHTYSIDIGEKTDSVELNSSFIQDYKITKSNGFSFIPNPFTLFCEFHVKRNQILLKKVCNMPSHKDNFEIVGGITKLSQDLKKLLLSGADSDVTIKIKEREFAAHKAIIGVRSPVFAAMLRSEMKEKATGVVDIDDLDPDIFPEFLSFLYTESVNELSAKNVFGLYVAADKYDVLELKSNCAQFMKNCLSVDTFCDVITISLRHNEKELQKEAINYFSNHLKEIIQTVQWQIFLSENAIQSNELLIKALTSWQQIRPV